MALAYIVLARNDMDENLLQVLDLNPNSSQRNPIYDGDGQTHYKTWSPQNQAVAVTGAGPITTDDVYYGLSAYILDNVENTTALPANLALTSAQVAEIATAILTRVQSGAALTLANINTDINAAAGVTASDLNGVVANSNSTGTVEEILRILAGEVYRLPAGSAIADATPNFETTRLGAFVEAPNVEQPESVRFAGRPVRGKSAFGPVIPHTAPVQTGLQDVNFRRVKQIVDGGSLQLSALSGVLDELSKDTYTFVNPQFTYGAGGTALLSDGTTVVPVGGQARAVTIYAADGTLI